VRSGAPASPVAQSRQINIIPARNNVPHSSHAASTGSELCLHPSLTQALSEHAEQSTGQNQLSGMLLFRLRWTRICVDAARSPGARAALASPAMGHALLVPMVPGPG